MIKTLLVLVSVFVLGSSQASELSTPSIFEEGVDESISPEDIGDDVRQWAQNTALKLQKLLTELKELLSPAEKRALLVKTIQESVLEAQNHKELLLMRFCLNRALALDELFGEENTLAVQQVLLPAVREAIFLYEKADLPFLDANKDKPQEEIEPPLHAAFTKASIGYLLNSSNLNKSLLGQFLILKYSIVWLAKDLLRSPQTKRNPINSALILDLEKIFEEVKDTAPEQITYKLNNRMRKVLLTAQEKIVIETSGRDILPFLRILPEPVVPKPEKSTPQVEKKSMFAGLGPNGGLLICDCSATLGFILIHESHQSHSKKAILGMEESFDPKNSISCEDGSGQKYGLNMFGLGVGLQMSCDRLSITYVGLGDIEGTYVGPRASAAALIGADVGVLSNGRMQVFILGLSFGIGGAASITGITIHKI